MAKGEFKTWVFNLQGATGVVRAKCDFEFGPTESPRFGACEIKAYTGQYLNNSTFWFGPFEGDDGNPQICGESLMSANATNPPRMVVPHESGVVN